MLSYEYGSSCKYTFKALMDQVCFFELLKRCHGYSWHADVILFVERFTFGWPLPFTLMFINHSIGPRYCTCLTQVLCSYGGKLPSINVSINSPTYLVHMYIPQVEGRYRTTPPRRIIPLRLPPGLSPQVSPWILHTAQVSLCQPCLPPWMSANASNT